MACESSAAKGRPLRVWTSEGIPMVLRLTPTQEGLSRATPRASRTAIPTGPSPWLVHLALLAVTLMFGANFVGMKLIMKEVPPLSWSAFRILTAALILVPLTPLLARGQRITPERRQFGPLVLAAILGIGLNQLLFALGLERTTPSHSSVLVATIPVLTLCAALAFGDERLSRDKIVAVGLAMVGVAILIDPQGDGEGDWVGDLYTFLNATSYAIFLVYVRRAGRAALGR